jgi:cytochrome c oxidase subunit 6a
MNIFAKTTLTYYKNGKWERDVANGTISAVIPALVLAGINAYNLWDAHWEHWSHMPPLEERTEYPYQNIRTKNFPWGDGDKTLL